MASRSSRSRGATAARLVVGGVVVLLLAVLVFVVISIGKMFAASSDRRGDVPTPNVVNLPLADAQQMLQDKQLLPELEYGNSDTAPKDVIFQQNPKSPKRVRAGSKVHIWVSMGPAHFIVPVLTGKQVDDAARELNAGGMVLGEVKKIYDPSLPPGQVVSQQPEAGREFAEAPHVDLLVADKETAAAGNMPNLLGQPIGSAEQMLVLAKLHLAKVTYALVAGATPGTVTAQSVAADKPAVIGQRVELTVALAPDDAAKQEKQLQVQVVVPEGPAQQQVRIQLIDALGTKDDLNETKAPHDTVSRMVDVSGDAKIVIYVRDMKTPWRTDVIPYVPPPPGSEVQPPSDTETPPGETGNGAPPGPAPPLGGGGE